MSYHIGQISNMDVPAKDVLQWYSDNIKLLQHTCWKLKYRSDCGKNITHEDLMAHTLDRIVNVFNNYDPTKGTKLSTFVMGSMYLEGMKYIEKFNRLAKKQESLSLMRVDQRIFIRYDEHVNFNVEYIDVDDLSDTIFAQLEQILSPIELRIYLLRSEDDTFDNIAEIVGLGVGKVKVLYWNSFYRVRKVIVDKYLDDYV